MARLRRRLFRLLHPRLYAGQLAEQRHQLLDLDPDSVCCLPGFTCPNCPPATTGGTR